MMGAQYIQYMLIKKGGRAIHKLGDLSRDELDAELILVHDEDDENYIGRFADGFGFCFIKFRKSDCRVATEEDLKLWSENRLEEVKF